MSSSPEPDGPVEPDPSTFTVGELCDRVERTVADAFPDEVWVQGAISGLSRSANGHVYFDLVEPSDEVGATATATVPVALFASSKMLVNRILRKAGGMRMHDGIEIRIRGRVAYYPARGRVQLIMSLIDPQFTLGQMVAARSALLDKLRVDGLLDRNQLLDLSPLPLRVALVTSGGSAAFADFVHEIEASAHPFRITLLDSRVQGMEAVSSVVSALETAQTLDVDVVVIVRGGGARTDLVAFDHEQVAVAVAGSRHPVLVGVGHEIDRSVADEVAHTSAKTPTACAAVLVDAVDRFVRRLDAAAGRLQGLTSLHLGSAQDRLVIDTERLARAARHAVQRNEIDLGHAARRLRQAPGRRLERADGHLANASVRLSALDPAAALARGWTITHTGSGRLVRSIAGLDAGTELRTTTMDGMIASTVVGTESATTSGADPEEPTG